MFYIKKILLLIIIVFIFTLTTKSDSLTIPEDALRFRVIANSNNIEDQEIKLKVKDNLEKKIYFFLKEAETLTDAKDILSQNLTYLDESVSSTLLANNFNYGHSINLGLNKFPNKEYKGVIYEEGNYDSLVVTLGNGKGDNWWCVLFPPLCLLEGEENSKDDIEYQFYVKKLINKYMK